MLLAHHTAGEPVATNWSFAPDPEVEPLVEVLSVHGSSEARDAPRTVRGARDGYFVRDQLARGVRFGFVGSGDSHDGHPGLAHLSPMYGARPTATGRTRELGTGGLEVRPAGGYRCGIDMVCGEGLQPHQHHVCHAA